MTAFEIGKLLKGDNFCLKQYQFCHTWSKNRAWYKHKSSLKKIDQFIVCISHLELFLFLNKAPQGHSLRTM